MVSCVLPWLLFSYLVYFTQYKAQEWRINVLLFFLCITDFTLSLSLTVRVEN